MQGCGAARSHSKLMRAKRRWNESRGKSPELVYRKYVGKRGYLSCAKGDSHRGLGKYRIRFSEKDYSAIFCFLLGWPCVRTQGSRKNQKELGRGGKYEEGSNGL